MKFLNIVLISLLLPVYSVAFNSRDTIPVKPVKMPDGFTSGINLVYTTVNGWNGRLDLYLPPTSNPPAPLLINIHGGAWTHGDKESQGGFSSFFKKGFAVANVEYRMSPIAPAPAAIQDTRCALMYLVKHAKEFNIDINRIVIMGASAGGHLALMTGLLQKNHVFDQNCPGINDFRIAAIIDKYGPADLSILKDLQHIRKSAYSWLGENVNNPSFLKSISPVYYVNRKSPPVFIVHGDSDPLVPYSQSVSLHDKLQQLGVKSEFITVPGGHHGKFPPEEKQRVGKAIIDFLIQCGVVQ